MGSKSRYNSVFFGLIPLCDLLIYNIRFISTNVLTAVRFQNFLIIKISCLCALLFFLFSTYWIYTVSNRPNWKSGNRDALQLEVARRRSSFLGFNYETHNDQHIKFHHIRAMYGELLTI